MKSSKLITLLGVLSVGVAALTGCAPGGGTSSVSGGPLVVYTPQGDGERGAYITEHAKSELGMDVKLVTGGGGALQTRLVSEKNNPQADVVLGLGEAQLHQVAAEGVLEPYAPAWANQIPANFRGNTHEFSLLTQTPIVLAYNTAQMGAAEAPMSWEDLAKPQYKNKFVLPGLTGQTGQAVVVGLLWRYADHKTGEVSPQGWDLVSKVLSNALPLPEGKKFDWGMVSSGQTPIVVNWLGGVQTGAADNKLTMQVVNTPGGTPFVSTGIGTVKDTKRQVDAQKFIGWFGSASFQVGFVKTTNNDTPLNSDAVRQLPEAAALAQVGKQDIDWSVVARKLPAWLEKIQLELQG
ncbi:extracellular solute-binding protein [Saccharopolyspora sp. NPDC050389]|uniref:extracellular solute-binding protein n=1 Tax=Saccharopolyspora sp. NPDC050389 TaxID=3155516 RepID=UPI0033F186A4